MQLSKKRVRSIQLAFLVVSTVTLLYTVCFFIAVLIQYPPARGDCVSYIGLGSSIILATLSIYGVKRRAKTKFSKESYYFVFLVIAISLLLFMWGDLILELGISVQLIATLSVLISTPLSIAMAGYSRRSFMKKLKKLGLNNGITLATIFILSLIPIMQFPIVIYSHTEKGFVLPNLIFHSTENTSRVNGLINGSGFFAEVPVYENRSFEAEKIVELIISNPNATIDLHFHILSFMGDFSWLEYFELYVLSSERAIIINMDNGFVQCKQAQVVLNSSNPLLLGVRSTGMSPLNSNVTLGLSLSICYHDFLLQKINFSLRALQ